MLNKIRYIKGYKESWIFTNSAMERSLSKVFNPSKQPCHIRFIRSHLNTEGRQHLVLILLKWEMNSKCCSHGFRYRTVSKPSTPAGSAGVCRKLSISKEPLWGQKVIGTSLATFCCIVSDITVSFPERPLIKFKARQAENTSGQKFVVQSWIIPPVNSESVSAFIPCLKSC